MKILFSKGIKEIGYFGEDKSSIKKRITDFKENNSKVAGLEFNEIYLNNISITLNFDKNDKLTSFDIYELNNITYYSNQLWYKLPLDVNSIIKTFSLIANIYIDREYVMFPQIGSTLVFGNNLNEEKITDIETFDFTKLEFQSLSLEISHKYNEKIHEYSKTI